MNFENDVLRPVMRDAFYSRLLDEIKSEERDDMNIARMIRRSLHEIVDAVQAEAGTLWILEEKEGIIYPYVSYGGSSMKEITLLPGQGIAGRTIETGNAEIVNSVTKSSIWSPDTDEKTGFTTNSVLCVPFRYNGNIIGCVQIVNKTDSSLFEERDVNFVSSLIDYLFESEPINSKIMDFFAERNAEFNRTEKQYDVNLMEKIFKGSSLSEVETKIRESETFRKMDTIKQNKYIFAVKIA